MEFHLNNPYISTKEEIIDMLNDIFDVVTNEAIKAVSNVQIGDVVDRVGFKDIKSVLITLKQFLEQRLIDVIPLIYCF